MVQKGAPMSTHRTQPTPVNFLFSSNEKGRTTVHNYMLFACTTPPNLYFRIESKLQFSSFDTKCDEQSCVSSNF